MLVFNFEERLSDSPYVELVWRNHSEIGGSFISMAISHWQMVFTRNAGNLLVTVRGPETVATQAVCPPEAEHFGIYFKHGVTLEPFPAGEITDGSVTLPLAHSSSFWINGSAWELPTYENADTFVDRLARQNLLWQDAVVGAILQAEPQPVSARSIQRRFLRTTGLTRGALSQINRARHAAILLRQGLPILDVIALAGYSDQPHLTRSLKRFIGLTPAKLIKTKDTQQLSFISSLREPREG